MPDDFPRLISVGPSGSTPLFFPFVVGVAEANGLNADRPLATMQAPETDETLGRNRALVHALGITGTPAFVVSTQLASSAVDQTRHQKMIEEA